VRSELANKDLYAPPIFADSGLPKMLKTDETENKMGISCSGTIPRWTMRIGRNELIVPIT